MKFTIAIDGPAASGKGTIAKAISEVFELPHLDTGLLYRAVGALAAGGDDPEEIARNLQPKDLERGDLRGEDAAAAASRVAANPAVRAELVDFQKKFAEQVGGAVLDGRDIGTVICPNADVKLFITASDVVRATRRWNEQGGENGGLAFETVLSDVRARDAKDSARAVSPLVAASDALIIDTSDLSVEQAIAKAIAAVDRAFNASQQ